MKFVALLFAVTAVFAQDDFLFPDGPAPDFSHTEFLAQSVQLTASANNKASRVFKASSPSAIDLRLVFEETELPADARVTIRSLFDGHEQYFNAKSLKDYKFHSAYFNGDAVEVTVESQTKATLAVSALIVGEEPPPSFFNRSKRTLCFSYDNRQRDTTRIKDSRFRLGGSWCSAWLINDQHGCFLTAGHCQPQQSAIYQFNVPDSTSGGGQVNPAPQFQFPVDFSSNQGVNGGQGNDWRYIGALPNSNTGLSPRQMMNTRGYVVSTLPNTPASGTTWQLFGHGSASGPTNAVAKGSQGSFTGRSGNRIQYRVSSTGGDSGSGVTFPGSGGDADGLAFAIHTHGGCRANGGSNVGTWVGHPNVQNALNNPRGVCATGY